MDTKYLINIDNGRLEFRDEYTDLQVNLKPVPDEVVELLMKGKVTVEEVLLAVGRKERERGFDLHKYVEDRKKLNVSAPDPRKTEKREPLRDRSDETISVGDVTGGSGEAEGKPAGKADGKKTPGKTPGKTPAEKKADEDGGAQDDGLSGVLGD